MLVFFLKIFFVGFQIYSLVLDMDKSWIFVTNRLSETYRSGVKIFIEQAHSHLDEEGKCRCPCKKCLNCYSHRIDIVERHIFLKGFSVNYVNWINHDEEDHNTPNVQDEEYDAEGEGSDNDDDEDEMMNALNDAFPDIFPSSVADGAER